MPGKSRARIQAEQQALEEGRGLEGAYSKALNIRATEYCMLGATNDELAAFFGVSLSTIERWQVEHPTFRAAILEGREAADGRVARALYRRATGMTVKKERAVVVRGVLKRLNLREELPPDTNAATIWLSNRQRAKWRSSNAGSAADAGFDLGAFVGAIAAGIGKGLQAQQPEAKAVEPQDVVFEPPKEG